MKPTGLIRKVDELGRVVLPAKIRRTLGVGIGCELEISVLGNQIILEKLQPSCVFCESVEELVFYSGKAVCSRCISNIKNG